MIERIADVPAGCVGFRASGEVSADDYRQVLEPTLRDAAESGEIRMLFALDGDFEMDVGAMVQDAKTGLSLGIGHHSAWKRSAIVTDVEWIDRAMRLFAWMVPGELRVFSMAEVEQAKEWVAL